MPVRINFCKIFDPDVHDILLLLQILVTKTHRISVIKIIKDVNPCQRYLLFIKYLRFGTPNFVGGILFLTTLRPLRQYFCLQVYWDCNLK